MTDRSEEVLDEVSRRVFLHKLLGGFAGVAGLLGLSNTGGLLQERQQSGYGGSSYGSRKK